MLTFVSARCHATSPSVTGTGSGGSTGLHEEEGSMLECMELCSLLLAEDHELSCEDDCSLDCAELCQLDCCELHSLLCSELHWLDCCDDQDETSLDALLDELRQP